MKVSDFREFLGKKRKKKGREDVAQVYKSINHPPVKRNTVFLMQIRMLTENYK